MKLTTPFSTYEVKHITLNHYMADNSLCVELWDDEEPIARLTTCLSKKGKVAENESYLDENNCPWAYDFIKKYKLGKVTNDVAFSGYCMYPKVIWNVEELEKYA